MYVLGIQIRISNVLNIHSSIQHRLAAEINGDHNALIKF